MCVCFSRAASNCDLFILTKASLDEAVMYYPNICHEIKRAAERKRTELIQKCTCKNKTMDSSKDPKANDIGCKFFVVLCLHNGHSSQVKKYILNSLLLINFAAPKCISVTLRVVMPS